MDKGKEKIKCDVFVSAAFLSVGYWENVFGC